VLTQHNQVLPRQANCGAFRSASPDEAPSAEVIAAAQTRPTLEYSKPRFFISAGR
jgi:hypothetical protein